MDNKNISDIINHSFENSEAYFGAATPPLIQSSNFVYPTIREMRHALVHEDEVPFYTRGTNPTTRILEEKMAALEGTEKALFFASGSAAVSAGILSVVQQGDHIVSVSKPYSWTAKLLKEYLPKFGVEASLIDGRYVENFEQAIKPNTRLIFLESPNSWTFEQQDLEAVAKLAKSKGILTMIDNSYASPLLQHPAKYGIDLIGHSATKYLSGHGDALGGVLCGSAELIKRVFKNEYMTLGAAASPFNAWQILSGLRTLPMRIKQAGETASYLVDFLKNHEAVAEVFFPYDPDNSQYDLSTRQMSAPAGQFSITLKTESEREIEAFANALDRFRLGCSWGGFESLAFPALTLYDSQNYASTVFPKNMIRFYAGLDDKELLREELENALRFK
ncbi:MAG: aminotransferase class V-fold PLP-dependent enzyme [Cyclobacteriaceae bacterium]|nr:aminotransferase class V-fold PLP-dependent enzyme [Cyclobacteriaceae bacterium]MCH8517670.1 aminotransferase class V-fold PLP-dependent enzyme [Cyclobacteriaceae bacterium]